MDEMGVVEVMDVNVWDNDDDDYEIPSDLELERRRQEIKENIKRKIDKIIRSNVSPSRQLEHTIIKLRSINTLTTYPCTPQDTEEPQE